MGFVKFGTCIKTYQFTQNEVLGPTPYFEECPMVYLGHQLEVAVYGLITFFNSVTLVVTLILLVVHERQLKASFARRPYTGVLSPVANACPRLSCIFIDYLRVKRVVVECFIVVVVVLLILLSVVDNANFTLVGDRTPSVSVKEAVVRVIDPTVACNGDPRYCELRINEYIWTCAHNAFSSLEDGFVVADHYYYNISNQLYAGIRSFMIDLWYDKINVSVSDEEDVYLCHSICVAGRRPFRTLAAAYNNFLSTYPNQVIMIIIEQYVNSSDIGRIMHEVGLDRYVWYSTQEPPSRNNKFVWPTLQELIDSGQRLMVVNDRTILDSAYTQDAPEWIYYSFDYQFENSYGTPDVSLWRCQITRGWCYEDPTEGSGSDANASSSTLASSPSSSSSGKSSSSSSSSPASRSSSCSGGDGCASSSSDSDYAQRLALTLTNCTGYPGPWAEGSDSYVAAMGYGNPPPVAAKLSTMNHFVSNGIGSPVRASKANVAASVQLTTFNCSTQWNQVVNILAFDYWTIANPLATVEAMNKNLLRYGKRYGYKNAWSMMLFGNNGYNLDRNRVIVRSDEENA